MPRKLLPQIERFRQARFLQISRNERNRLAIESSPPTKSAGFYWIYTNYSQFDLEQQQGAACKNAVNIGMLAQLHCGLANMCKISTDEFRLVYNGIAAAATAIKTLAFIKISLIFVGLHPDKISLRRILYKFFLPR